MGSKRQVIEVYDSDDEVEFVEERPGGAKRTVPISGNVLASQVQSASSSAPDRVQLVPRTRGATEPAFDPPFPSTLTIPPRFLFLMHATKSDPRTWSQREVRPTEHRAGLKEYPGAYFTLVTEDNVQFVDPFECEIGCYVGVFALDLLKQRNWHINLQDIHGNITSSLTFFPWQLDQIAELMRDVNFNEVVFHDPVPFDPFLRDVIKVTTKGRGREQSTSDFKAQAIGVGRVELEPDGVVAALNPVHPQYCWPSFFKHDDQDFAHETDARWTRAIADACGLDWDQTLAANKHLVKALSSCDDYPERRVYGPALFAQTEHAWRHRGVQNLHALHRLSLEPDRFEGFDIDFREEAGYLEGGGDRYGIRQVHKF